MTLRKIFPLAAAALLVAAVPSLAASDLWFHVTVVEHGGDNANVTLNLPISIVEKALPLLPEDAHNAGHIRIEDADFDAAQLRDLWRELQETPDMTFITVQTDDETVRVYKEGGYMVARTTEADEDGTHVNARIPLAVVDALLSGEGDELNLVGALQALAAHGAGELVTVSDREANVRVWIDDRPEAPAP